MKTINYESDFPLSIKPKEIDSMSGQPFELVFYTKKAVRTFTAKYDGKEYTNCRPTEDRGVVVFFDNHKLGLGVLWVDVHVPLTDKDFADGVCNYRSTEPTGIVLDKGATDDLGGFSVDVFPFFKQGEDGKSAYDLWLEQGNEGSVQDFLNSLKGEKGDKMTYDDLTEDEKEDLAGHFKLNVVNNLEEGGEDKALSAEMGKRLNKMISRISLEGGGETKLSGKLNLTSIDEIKSTQKALSKTNEIAFYLVTDSTGKIPSAQSCYNIPSEAVRQLSLTSPDVTTNIVLNLLSVNMQPIGVNVGDFIALTRVKVKVSDLAASIGASINLDGEIEIYQYKILSMNDAKPAGHSEANAGVMGLMSPWDKGQVNKINGIESTANNTRNGLDSVVNNGLFKTKYGYHNLADTCLNTGVNNYFKDTIGGITANWTLFVTCSYDGDPNYYHLLQTAIGRDNNGNLGRIFQRMGWYKGGGEDLHFTDWKEVGGGSSDIEKSPTHGGLDIATNALDLNDDIENLTPIGVVSVYSSNDDSIGEVAFSAIFKDGIVIKTADYSYVFIKNEYGEWVLDEKTSNYSERYATKYEVSTAIANAITNTLNTDV